MRFGLPETETSNLSAERKEFLSNVTSLDGRKCLLGFWNTPPFAPQEPHCNATWDSFFCWPTTAANATVRRSCHDILGNVPGAEHASAFRTCDATGNWLDDKTNFSECLAVLSPNAAQSQQHEDAEVIGVILFYGSTASFVALAATLFIFCYFKSLQCDRISVHKHLSTALMVRVVLNIVMTEPIVAGRNGGYTNEAWLCRLVLLLKLYATVASINWMFIEGLYLHSRVTTSVFSTRSPFRLYYVLGWAFPITIVTLWAVVMTHGRHQSKCWLGYANQKPIWIIVVPVALALAMNLLFLVNIIRILVTKLRASVAIETTQVRKAIKATAILFPLLGLPNLFVCVNPRDKGDFEEVYLFTNAILESSQGIFVAILYCFTNSEVIEVMKKEYGRRSWHFRSTSNHHNTQRNHNNSVHSARSSVSFVGEPQPTANRHKRSSSSSFREARKTFWVKLGGKYGAKTETVVGNGGGSQSVV